DSAQAAATPRPAAPTLWAVFQMEVFQPRSLVENQWTRMRPEAGQPMPGNQPLMNMTVAKTAMVPETHGTKATTRLVSAERARPIGRKSRALERSEIVAMKNFESPYANRTAFAMMPIPIVLRPLSSISSGATRETLLRIR